MTTEPKDQRVEIIEDWLYDNATEEGYLPVRPGLGASLLAKLAAAQSADASVEKLKRVRDWLCFAANSRGGIVAEIDAKLDEVQQGEQAQKPCLRCGNRTTHGESGREWCSTCGGEVLAQPPAAHSEIEEASEETMQRALRKMGLEALESPDPEVWKTALCALVYVDTRPLTEVERAYAVEVAKTLPAQPPAASEDAWETGEAFRAEIESILMRYRCQYSYENDNGDHLHLVDVLSHGDTIQEGQEEIHLIADDLAAALYDRLRARVTGSSSERERRLEHRLYETVRAFAWLLRHHGPVEISIGAIVAMPDNVEIVREDTPDTIRFYARAALSGEQP